MNKAILTNHQVSMTEWFAAIGELEQSNEFRDEDNRKAERLGLLKRVITIPYREPVVLPARHVLEKTPEFAQLLTERGDESVAYRLTSEDTSLPKLRNRGLSLRACYETWFLGLDIDFDKYVVSIFPNEVDIEWSTIFVITKEAIFGEIIAGRHNQLSQGETQEKPYYFRYDFQTWQWSEKHSGAQEDIKRAVEALHVRGSKQQAILKEELNAEFSHNYLMGYFETTTPRGEDTFFIDYNRILPQFITAPSRIGHPNQKGLSGVTACEGIAQGPVVVVSLDEIEGLPDFPEGSVLVCDNTDVRYLPLMQKACAIVTNRGGMLSHAAIIARELRKPCVIGTKNATDVLKNGQIVSVDANKGIIS